MGEQGAGRSIAQCLAEDVKLLTGGRHPGCTSQARVMGAQSARVPALVAPGAGVVGFRV